MKVLHVVGAYPSPEQPHSQVFVKTQVESLEALGVECAVLVLQGRGPLKYAAGRSQVRARLRGGGFDLLHAHYAYCAVPSLGHGLPVVVSLLGSDLYGRPRPDGGYSRGSRALHRALCRFAADRAAACIVKSRRMREDLARSAHVVPNGVDLARFRPAGEEARRALRAELGLRDGTRYVIFGADPARPRKRFGLARRAVERAAAELDFPVELLAVHGRPHDDVVRYLQASDLLILTSTLEGSPNIVKEAMACDLGVVSVDVGDAHERLDGVSGCRVTADDRAETIAAAVRDVLTSGEAPAGRSAVRELSLEAVAERVRMIYAAALGGAPAGTG
jgi:glycosyltransferase involved in cell wall biosynthesis